MTDTPIRQLTGDDMLETLFALGTYAFRATPPYPDKAEFFERARGREGWTYFALFRDGRPMAGAASVPLTQQVRGAIYPIAGVLAVVTDPAARRQGYSRQVLARLMAADRENGRPLSCLYPFRESFYERLGYITFPLARIARFSPLSLAPLVKRDLGGQVERVLLADGYDVYHSYVLRLQQRTHGMAVFDFPDRAGAVRNPLWLALAQVNGEPAGVMLYQLTGQDIGQFKLEARQFYYDSSQGRYLLLQWIGRHADQAGEAAISLAPFEWPETWLADIKVNIGSAERAAMGRVLDVAGIGGMHTGPGRFSARILDPLCPWNEGVWQFETAGGELHVSPGGRAGCDLTIQGLSALVYGTHDPNDLPLRGWGNPTTELQAKLRALFPPRVPYVHEVF